MKMKVEVFTDEDMVTKAIEGEPTGSQRPLIPHKSIYAMSLARGECDIPQITLHYANLCLHIYGRAGVGLTLSAWCPPPLSSRP